MTTKWSAAVARAMHELEAATPSAPPWESMQLVPSHPEHSRRRAPLLVGAMVALAASGLAGLVVLRGDQPERSSAPAGATMHHVRVTYSLTSDLTCDEFPSAETSTAEIELFADRAGRRWRTSVTAIDGATADLILAMGRRRTRIDTVVAQAFDLVGPCRRPGRDRTRGGGAVVGAGHVRRKQPKQVEAADGEAVVAVGDAQADVVRRTAP